MNTYLFTLPNGSVEIRKVEKFSVIATVSSITDAQNVLNLIGIGPVSGVPPKNKGGRPKKAATAPVVATGEKRPPGRPRRVPADLQAEAVQDGTGTTDVILKGGEAVDMDRLAALVGSPS
jgi:hypothetical protein